MEPLLVRKAHAFAEKAHAGVFRKWSGEPYIRHPERVAARLAAMGFPAEVVAAAYLHDVVEDTPVSGPEIAAEFGPEVAALVLEVTKPIVPGNRAARKAAFREHLAKASYFGASIKLSDELDNSSNVEELAPEFAAMYLPEMREELKVLSHGHPELVAELSSRLAV
jgi:(p)ppGpp synthase/HD superfamily hydrolase